MFTFMKGEEGEKIINVLRCDSEVGPKVQNRLVSGKKSQMKAHLLTQNSGTLETQDIITSN